MFQIIDSNKTILGTSGNDVFTSYTDDTAGGNYDANYQINAGAGDDLIVGGIEPTDVGYVEGILQLMIHKLNISKFQSKKWNLMLVEK